MLAQSSPSEVVHARSTSTKQGTSGGGVGAGVGGGRGGGMVNLYSSVSWHMSPLGGFASTTMLAQNSVGKTIACVSQQCVIKQNYLAQGKQ